MALDYLNNLTPSHRKLAVVMVGLALEHASRELFACGLATFPPKASFVGGRVASFGGQAKFLPTFKVHNFCQVSVIEWYSDCP